MIYVYPMCTVAHCGSLSWFFHMCCPQDSPYQQPKDIQRPSPSCGWSHPILLMKSLNGLVCSGKSSPETMGFYHQIDWVFRLKCSHHPILWISFLGLVVANPPGQISWIESQASLNHVLGAAEMSGSFNPPLAKSRFFLPVKWKISGWNSPLHVA
jgi:hypothetical protein